MNRIQTDGTAMHSDDNEVADVVINEDANENIG